MAPQRRSPAPRALLTTAAIAVALAAADTYVVVLALTDMMRGVGVGIDSLQRATPIVSGFLLGYVAVLPLVGRLADLVDRLSQHNEARVGQDWRFEYDRPEMMRQLRGIIGFRFRATRIDMTFKLSQNHPAANVRGVAAGLRALGGEDNLEIAGMMLGHLPPG